MTAQVICMANFKGGVAKTTTAVNLAGALARMRLRVLLVDCDPQANASEMFVDENDIEFDLRSIIVEKVPIDKVVRSTRIEGLDVLPSSFDLALLDKELVLSPNGVWRIERALRPIQGDYDVIVIDTGPNLSHLTLGSLVAAHHIIIPVSAAVWSAKGLVKFMRWIEANREEEIVSAELLGLVATIVTPRTRIGRDVVQALSDSPYPSFDTAIPKRIGAEDAVQDRSVAGEPGVDAKFSKAYLAFAEEVAAKLRQNDKRGAHRGAS